MPSVLTLVDVKGDGHCFYRCLYRIIKGDADLRSSFHLLPPSSATTNSSEDDCIWTIRTSIAQCFVPDNHPRASSSNIGDRDLTRDIVRNLLRLKLIDRVTGLDALYPLLRVCNDPSSPIKSQDVVSVGDRSRGDSSAIEEGALTEAMALMYDMVAGEATFASQIEIEIVKNRLASKRIHLAVLSQTRHDRLGEVEEKWLTDITSFLASCAQRQGYDAGDDVSIILNVDNVHYKILKFHGAYRYPLSEFEEYIRECHEETESSSGSDID